MSLHMTASQTVGPYLHIGMHWLDNGNLAGEGVSGERVAIEGRVVDGSGAPVADGMIEIWQANAHGKYAHPDDPRELPVEAGFKGFGRLPTGPDGQFRFSTIKPGRVPGPQGQLQAPHIVVVVFMRGLLKHLVTRIYFDDEAANADDPVLQLVPADRRHTLVAARTASGAYEFNITVQGDAKGHGETVFFDI